MTNDSNKTQATLTSKHFEFQNREQALYQMWEQSGCFRSEYAKDQSAPVFDIAMPPPNANGELHLGHAFGYTVKDILGRFHRLLGERVLLLPGKDHAGIQTQVVFEKKLAAQKIDAKAQDPQKLFEQCYAFCMDRSQYMRAQEKRLGLSADWSREIFTLDPRVSDVVFETFEKMWKDGLIYRGERIINWSVFSQTAISDVEVEYKEQDGHLWYIQYLFPEGHSYQAQHSLPLPSGAQIPIGEHGLVVATTRPETMLGDTALAVHPEDARYQAFIGKEIIVPLVHRRIPIIADKRIDPEFGTGVVKVTPAHDFNDYDIGKDHQLPIIRVIGKDGKMTEEAGAQFQGLTTQACRDLVITQLESLEALVDITKIKHKVPIGERGKDVIEPLLSEQWFVNVDKPELSLKKRALDLIRSGRIKVYPERFQGLFEQWLENLRDWNISRQLWWGHRLPVWYRTKQDGTTEFSVGRDTPSGENWIQEKDTFDTWFSSGQWAFSTMAAEGFVDLNSPQSDFFPTHTMVMGRDILFFWACRMLLLTAYRTNEVPWKNIFFTGLIRDEKGQKMSKSKGNGIDPLAMVEKYGADALRLALVMGATPGNDMSLSERKFDGYSKFINKLWNAAKLIEMKIQPLAGTFENRTAELQLASSRWILSGAHTLFTSVTEKFKDYEISIAADEMYKFTWQTFCDWYLEMMKIIIDKGTEAEKQEAAWVVTNVFRDILLMLHPILPYITEEIYQAMPVLQSPQHGNKPSMLATETWSFSGNVEKVSPSLRTFFEAIDAIRSVKSALNISHQRIQVAVEASLSDEEKLLLSEMVKADLCDASSIAPEKALKKPIAGGVIVCEVDGKENYLQRLQKELITQQTLVASLEKKFAGDFGKLAKPEIIEKEQERLSMAKEAVHALEKELATIG